MINRDEDRVVAAPPAPSRAITKTTRMFTKALTAGLSLLALVTTPVQAAGPTAGKPGETEQADLSEVNKQLTNPVSELWSITLQQNNFRVKPGPGEEEFWSNNLLFQPVLPVGISPSWNLITRPVIPLVMSTLHPKRGDPTELDRSTGFGDIALMQLVSPNSDLVGKWLLGIGPTWIFPSASSDFTGQGKYQVGPAAIAGYLSEKWIFGALIQNWWSFAGDDDRASTNSMNLQPIAAYFLPEGWSVGYSGNILANWENRSGDRFTVPVGVQVAKVVKFGKLPVRIALGGQWMAVQPDRFGQKWNIQVIVAPVLPKLIRGTLDDPRNMSFGLGKK